MKIHRFSAKDVLRLKVVEITPTGHVVTLGGKNGAGKSSVLNSIEMTLGGKRATPDEPIRRGAAQAEIVLDLGEMVVKRTISGGTDRLVVEQNGKRVPRPREALEAIVGPISADPQAFARMAPKEQADTLRKLLGLDFAERDARRAKLYEDRTSLNRVARVAKDAADTAPFHPDAPASKVDVGALDVEFKRRSVETQRHMRCRQNVERGEERFQEQERQVERIKQTLADALYLLAAKRQEVDALEAIVADLVDPDAAGAQAALVSAEDTNRKVRENAQRLGLIRNAEKTQSDADALTADIDQIDEAKRADIAAATFPVPGLGFAPDGIVTYNDIPFAQAATSEKLRVSVAIAIALNPKLRVFFVRDGSLLDEDGLRLIAEMTEANDAQVWIEDARTADPEAIIIEDGTGHSPEPDAQEPETP